MPSTDELLDLAVAKRASSFRFDVLDVALNEVGTADVSAASPPSISNDTDRAIKRQLSGLRMSPAQAAELDPLSSRLRPVMILQDGTEWPLGVFLFSGYDRTRYSWGEVPMPTLHDQGVILDQACERTISHPPGSLVTDRLGWLLARFDLPAGYVIQSSTARTSAKSAMVWPAGTSYKNILTETAALAGFYSGYFDNAGVLQFRAPGAADGSSGTDLWYPTRPDGPSRVLAGSVVVSDDLLNAPNRYIVIDSSATDVPVFGWFDVPASAPHSAANRGFIVSSVTDRQGVGSNTNAMNVGRSLYAAARSYEWLTFDSPPDPRHDTFQTVDFDGVVYRETGWSMTLEAGGKMSHELRRTY